MEQVPELKPTSIPSGAAPKIQTLGRVTSEDELIELYEKIRKENEGRLLLFRGQNQLYEKIRSSKARPNVSFSEELENGWLSLVRRHYRVEGEPVHCLNFAMALLQHYSVATHFVDLTPNICVAGWFATHAFKKETVPWFASVTRFFDRVEYETQKEGTSYIIVLAIDEIEPLMKSGHLVCLAELPNEFTRPHRQEGWLLYDCPPVSPTPNEYQIGVIEVDNTQYASRYSQDYLFPSPGDDKGYLGFRDTPFIPIPLVLTPDHKGDEDLCAAGRVLPIDEYSCDGNDKSFGHKWTDILLYEPHAVRVWVHRHFPLDKLYEGISADIADATKITVSPSAKETLESLAKDDDCEWPDLETNSIFFSFAQSQHDKFIDTEPPYLGLWLYKRGDLIIAHPTYVMDDEETMSVGAGHGFRLIGGNLYTVSIAGECDCGDPERTRQEVLAALSMSRAVRETGLVFLRSPYIPWVNWYILF